MALALALALAACSPDVPPTSPAPAAPGDTTAILETPGTESSPTPSPSIPAASSPASTPAPTLGPAVLSIRSPAKGAVVAQTKVVLAASSDAGQAPAGVSFTVSWHGAKERTACVAKIQPDGSWQCTADLGKLGTPVGDITFGAEVLDVAGQGSPASAVVDVTYAPKATASWSWQTIGRDTLYADSATETTSGTLVGSLHDLFAGPAYCIDDVTMGPYPFGGLVLPVLNPSTGQVRPSSPSASVNGNVTVVPVSGGRVLVVGAATRQTETRATTRPAAELYSPKTDRWKETTAPAAAGPAAVALDGDHVALIGGSTGSSGSNHVDVLTVSSGRLRTLARLPKGVASSIATILADGRILVVPNRDGDATTYLIDPDTGSVRSLKSPAPGDWWREVWPLPEGGAAVAAIEWNNRHGVLVTAVLSPGGKSWGHVQRVTLGWDEWAIGHDANGRAVIVGGGRQNRNNCTRSTFTARAFALDPRTGKITGLPDLPAGGGVSWMTLLPDGRIVADMPLGPNKPNGVGILGP